MSEQTEIETTREDCIVAFCPACKAILAAGERRFYTDAEIASYTRNGLVVESFARGARSVTMGKCDCVITRTPRHDATSADALRARCEEAERQRDEARRAADEIDFRGRDLAELCDRLESALREAFDEGYDEGYSNGGSDVAAFECGSGSKGRSARAKDKADAWEYSDAQKALAQPAHASGEEATQREEDAECRRIAKAISGGASIEEALRKPTAPSVEAQIENEGSEP